MMDNEKQLETNPETQEKIPTSEQSTETMDAQVAPAEEQLNSETDTSPTKDEDVTEVFEAQETTAKSQEVNEETTEVVEPVENLQETLEQELITLRQKLELQSQQAEQVKSQYMRIVADFENFRRRTAKEKGEVDLQVKRNTLSELLSVVDNFERARNQIKPNGDGEMAIHKSYQGVYKNLVESLKKLGVSAMRPEGKPFDPNYHEAMLREETDEYPEGTVMEQLVRGYLIGEQVLRHAMVKVAAAKEITNQPEAELSQPEAEMSQEN